MTKKIVLVGGGNMGEALVAGLVRSGHWKPSQITVCDVRPDQLASLQLRYKVKASADNRWAARDASVILLAVKPQHMEHVLGGFGTGHQTNSARAVHCRGYPHKIYRKISGQEGPRDSDHAEYPGACWTWDGRFGPGPRGRRIP